MASQVTQKYKGSLIRINPRDPEVREGVGSISDANITAISFNEGALSVLKDIEKEINSS